jgi:hypothetical protein
MARRINIAATANPRAIKAVLRELGFEPEDLELVRGNGYYYLSGEATVDLHEQGLYGMGMHLTAYTTREWVDAILERMTDVFRAASWATRARREAGILALSARVSEALRAWDFTRANARGEREGR